MGQTGRDAISAYVDTVRWRKSLHSNPSGNCVELAPVPGVGIAVRNSRDPDGPVLLYTPDEISAFLQGAKAGQFDDLIVAEGAEG
jgi:hypothetical protein